MASNQQKVTVGSLFQSLAAHANSVVQVIYDPMDPRVCAIKETVAADMNAPVACIACFGCFAYVMGPLMSGLGPLVEDEDVGCALLAVALCVTVIGGSSREANQAKIIGLVARFLQGAKGANGCAEIKVSEYSAA